MSHNSIVLAAVATHQQKGNTNYHSYHNHTSQFYNYNHPGAVNIVIGGAMLGTMILFFMWMCYFCRCKVSKSEETSSTTSTPPYWIDMDSDGFDRNTVCDENETYHSFRRFSEMSSRRSSPPPTYESVFHLPPTYEDAVKSINEKCSQ